MYFGLKTFELLGWVNPKSLKVFTLVGFNTFFYESLWRSSMNTNEFEITAAYSLCYKNKKSSLLYRPMTLCEFYIKRSKQKLHIQPVIHIVNRL